MYSLLHWTRSRLWFLDLDVCPVKGDLTIDISDGGDCGGDDDGDDGDDDDGGDVHKMMDWESADRVVRADLFISLMISMMLPPSNNFEYKIFRVCL